MSKFLTLFMAAFLAIITVQGVANTASQATTNARRRAQDLAPRGYRVVSQKSDKVGTQYICTLYIEPRK